MELVRLVDEENRASSSLPSKESIKRQAAELLSGTQAQPALTPSFISSHKHTLLPRQPPTLSGGLAEVLFPL